MEQISAAGNLTIEMEADRWRLVVNGASQGQTLLEAIPGRPLRYVPIFASKRRLPDSGELTSEQIQRVVLGWSNEDESWHLGLLLGPELTQTRGSRWCEIARWPDPDTTVFSDIATQAGRRLAAAISRPFNYIEPQVEEKTPPPPPPLPALPLAFDLWRLEQRSALQLVRSPSWGRSRLLRVAWYIVLAAVYAVLSVTTLTGIIALPKPEFLPYLGLGIAGLLVLLALSMVYQTLVSPGRIVIDATMRTIRGQRGRFVRWQTTADEVQGVYVSQIVGKKGRKRVIHFGELNLHLGNGRFKHLFDQSQFEDNLLPLDVELGNQTVAPLDPYAVYSDLQAAGAYIAQALGVPCFYDQRGK
jgi:hypothetical protein